MPAAVIDGVRKLEDMVRELPQEAPATQHVFHAGLYARTITLKADRILTGALIKIATLVIVNGDVSVVLANGAQRLTGYNVLPASAGRKQVFLAHADTQITMIFATNAQDVDAAEQEFTDEYDLLMSHHGINEVIMTGE